MLKTCAALIKALKTPCAALIIAGGMDAARDPHGRAVNYGAYFVTRFKRFAQLSRLYACIKFTQFNIITIIRTTRIKLKNYYDRL